MNRCPKATSIGVIKSVIVENATVIAVTENIVDSSVIHSAASTTSVII